MSGIMNGHRETITVGLGGRAYDIHVGHGMLDRAGQYLKPLARGIVPVVTDRHVADLHLERLLQVLTNDGIAARPIVMAPGEASKSFAGLERLCGELLDMEIDRTGLIVALGGGVIGDLTGFAAGVLKRGVGFAQIPTTLLAQVDSSVGGKTGINHPLGKNMIGAFHQPLLVVCDLASLDTLPARELSAGLAEVIKYGPIHDMGFMEWLEAHMDALRARDRDALAHAVRRCCEIKAEVVAQDERESGLRAILNFGHTFGHAMEAGMGYGVWLHGEGVGAGMLMAAELSRRLGLVDAAFCARLRVLVQRAGLPVRAPVLDERDNAGRYLEWMRVDKKSQAGEIRFVLIDGPGKAVVRSAPDALVREVIDACCAPA